MANGKRGKMRIKNDRLPFHAENISKSDTLAAIVLASCRVEMKNQNKKPGTVTE